ncbi:transcriptional regulator [Thalassospira sp. HJ]|uniref:winged helix DNA-binding protein n=1 Tax=Thalassospira sp. HJ TaxID=1616823 RepID=UPI0005CE0A60|nr:winged helix DNA-binding protein [Thalassospira sp. HJ]KJE35980.1 transcriptional regulator [Thalassospira sp. HJ]
MADKTRIVSSSHLVSERAAELSELEFALILSGNAFNRWMVRCMRAAGMPDVSVLDILVLHNVNSREREKSLSEVCFVLNVEDSHLVNYSLKKLRKLGLVDGVKRGKEVHYATTAAGRDMCEKYRQVREDCLVETFQRLGVNAEEVGDVAKTLRAISGVYDQASRAASSI